MSDNRISRHLLQQRRWPDRYSLYLCGKEGLRKGTLCHSNNQLYTGTYLADAHD